MSNQFGETLLTHCVSLKSIAYVAAASAADDITPLVPNLLREQIDAINDARQIVPGCAVQQADLRINNDRPPWLEERRRKRKPSRGQTQTTLVVTPLAPPGGMNGFRPTRPTV